jgi:TIR domain
MIQVIQGSIFDAKCDLLIVPCDSTGGVTSSVLTNLRERGLPTRVGRIPYGRVHFREAKYEFASTLGYAASVEVESVSSDSEAIKRIAGEILRYSRENQIRKINIPLLGSGAGGMTPADSFESLRSILAYEDDITFNIFCFTREVYRNVAPASGSVSQETATRHPRVFISYTGTDKENSRWVKTLAEALRANGVDARVDVFHLKPGFDLPQWMTNEVIMADKVLLICDRFYMEKADFKKGGVGWETMIIQGDMLAQGDNKQKYIAIVREDAAEKALPIYMKSKYAFSWGHGPQIDPERLKELVLCIFDCDTEPELGTVPDYVKRTIRKKPPTKQQARADRRGTGRSA